MEVVLLENIKNLGNIGDVVNVKRGQGRNFLIKFGKALKASKTNIDLVNKKKAELNEKNVALKRTARKTRICQEKPHRKNARHVQIYLERLSPSRRQRV